MKFYLVFSALFSLSSLGAADQICDDLAKFSCAPGTYDDGTGVVRSEAEVQERLRTFMASASADLRAEVTDLIRNPDSQYFRQNSMAALGLAGSPGCVPESNGRISSSCEENLIVGLTDLIQRNSLGSLISSGENMRGGNAEELNFVMSDENYQRLVKRLNQRADRELIDQEMVGRIRERIFPDMKAAILARIRQLNVSEEQKNFMIMKISAVQFAGTDCTALNDKNETHLDQLLTPNAYYSPSRNTFSFCNGYLLQSTSVFSIAKTIVHELTHSIDPCQLGRGPAAQSVVAYSNPRDLRHSEIQYPFTNVIQCLRGESSINARNFDYENQRLAQLQWDQMEAQRQAQLKMQQQAATTIPAAAVATPQGSVSGGIQGPYPYLVNGMGGPIGAGMPFPPRPEMTADFCGKDQITEAFPDWMAAEVVPGYVQANYRLTQDQYRNGYGNYFRLGCRERSAEVLQRDHPESKDRINRILLANPRVRSQMGCNSPSPATYCDNNKEYATGFNGSYGNYTPVIGAGASGVPAGGGGFGAPPGAPPVPSESPRQDGGGAGGIQ